MVLKPKSIKRAHLQFLVLSELKSALGNASQRNANVAVWHLCGVIPQNFLRILDMLNLATVFTREE